MVRECWLRSGRIGGGRLQANEGTALLQLLLQMLDAHAGIAFQEVGRDRTEGPESGVLRLLEIGGERHRTPAGASFLGPGRQAGKEPDHFAQERLSWLNHRR